jgi:hypothetical protein
MGPQLPDRSRKRDVNVLTSWDRAMSDRERPPGGTDLKGPQLPDCKPRRERAYRALIHYPKDGGSI